MQIAIASTWLSWLGPFLQPNRESGPPSLAVYECCTAFPAFLLLQVAESVDLVQKAFKTLLSSHALIRSSLLRVLRDCKVHFSLV